MKFPHDYPYSPPSIRFLTKVWHPNVYEVSLKNLIIFNTKEIRTNLLQNVMISIELENLLYFIRQFDFIFKVLTTTCSKY